MARSSVLLASGGMDSMMMWRLLGQPPILYCSVHAPYGATELGALMWPQTVDYLKVSERIDLRNLELSDGHIPFRNLALVLAAALEGYDTIYLGALAGESSRDKSGRFFRDVSRLLSYCENKSVKVVAPFRHKTKTELVQTYLKLRVPTNGDLTSSRGSPIVSRVTLVEDLLRTRSCYTGRYPGCGQCMACFRRWVALFLNGIAEQYEHHPWEWREVELSNWKTWLHSTSSIPLSEWPAVARNNAQGLKALHMARKSLQGG